MYILATNSQIKPFQSQTAASKCIPMHTLLTNSQSKTFKLQIFPHQVAKSPNYLTKCIKSLKSLIEKLKYLYNRVIIKMGCWGFLSKKFYHKSTNEAYFEAPLFTG